MVSHIEKSLVCAGKSVMEELCYTFMSHFEKMASDPLEEEQSP